MKATVKNAKALGACRPGGWGTFKHRLMEALGVPASRFNEWSVPPEWRAAFKRANGREPEETPHDDTTIV